MYKSTHVHNFPRFRILKDNDGHTFCVPIARAEGFDEWLAAVERGDDPPGHDYGGYEIDGVHRLTFVDPKEE